MNKMMLHTRDGSVLNRLLEELSWVGRNIKDYREGGLGFENVLTAEALQALDFLPRAHFLGHVFRASHGSCSALTLLADQVENCEIELLPGNYYLRPNGDSHVTGMAVQPDGIIESPGVCCLLEAKRIKRSQFGVKQLAREYFLVTRDCKEKLPLLFLVLPEPPPVLVTSHGRLTIENAIRLSLAAVYQDSGQHPHTLEELDSTISDRVAWITWQEIANVVSKQAEAFVSESESIVRSVQRLATAIKSAVARHS
jgi:hypothetical protein